MALDKMNIEDIRFMESLNRIEWPIDWGHVFILIQSGKVVTVEIAKKLKAPRHFATRLITYDEENHKDVVDPRLITHAEERP